MAGTMNRGREVSPSERWAVCRDRLREASVSPEQRPLAVRRALGAAVRALSASGVAFIRPGYSQNSGWLVEYSGSEEAPTRRWLDERISASLKETVLGILASAARPADASPSILPIGDENPAASGLMVVFGGGCRDLTGEIPNDVQCAMETLIEVEELERNFLGEGVILSGLNFIRPPSDGLMEMLSLAKEVSGAGFTYWGSVHEGIVDVEWSVGASDSSFGFELPLGEGLGGRAFARGEAFEVVDYLNCQYRYPGVSEATDSEKVRTALAIPVHGGSGAVLYAVRREVEAFSPAQLAMLTQVRNAIEPVSEAWTSPGRLYPSSLDHLCIQKSELRRMLLQCDHIRDLESWLERLLKGTAILLDGSGHPYVPKNLHRLEHPENRMGIHHTFPLPESRASGGRLDLWTPLDLPLEGWPDLIDDAVAAFGVVVDRIEQAHERLSRKRSQWLRSITTGNASKEATDDLRRDGMRLGLPVQSGEVWSLAWDTGCDLPHLWRHADDIVLDLLGGPLISVDGGVGVVLLREPRRRDPSAIRDELLRHVGPTPLWLAHGASFESFECLRGTLLRSTSAVNALRRSDKGDFVTEVDGRDLDSLLGNPAVFEEFIAFTDKMLAPLIDHDARRNTRLTETFCYTLVLGSPAEAAKELYIHPNTVRYRIRSAESILSVNLHRPKERTALSLAAFVWMGRQRLG